MNTPQEIYSDYVRSQVNLLFDLGMLRQSDVHEACFRKVIAHLKELYRVAPSVFPTAYVERITRYKKRFESGAPPQDFELADFQQALQLVQLTDYTSLGEKCRTLQDVVDLVIRQNHKNRQDKIGGSGTLVSRRAVRRQRTPNCWNCKGGLDNHYHLECSSCGWIVCPCGACGCGWAQAHRDFPRGHRITQTNYDEYDMEPYIDDESNLIDAEVAEYNDDAARSAEDGWFYSDEDPEWG